MSKICNASHYKKADDKSKRKYIEEIFKRIKRCRTIYITIPAGISRCIELIIKDNYRHTRHLRTYDSNKNFDFDEFKEIFDYKGAWIDHDILKLDHYAVLENERFCKSCERITCKSLVEECDVV